MSNPKDWLQLYRKISRSFTKLWDIAPVTLPNILGDITEASKSNASNETPNNCVYYKNYERNTQNCSYKVCEASVYNLIDRYG